MLIFKEKNYSSHIFSNITHLKMNISPLTKSVIEFTVYTPVGKSNFFYEYADTTTAVAKYEEFMKLIQAVDYHEHTVVIEE